MSFEQRVDLDAAIEASELARAELEAAARKLRWSPDDPSVRRAFETAQAKHERATRNWTAAFQAHERGQKLRQ